ncbi:hypothetical protein ATJ93_2482 [Halopiger aswanensis]|uniref:Uncharacterized protein n=1 Tax=Halopiger aswanensis TaxID=148449 RepID=A0A419WJK3_9EURY|nr:hypothetical protein ATJ93_2482 [Halopiger aswanensis]
MTVHEIAEAERLLEKVGTWSETELEELPRFYRERAERYRKLRKHGDPEQL